MIYKVSDCDHWWLQGPSAAAGLTTTLWIVPKCKCEFRSNSCCLIDHFNRKRAVFIPFFFFLKSFQQSWRGSLNLGSHKEGKPYFCPEFSLQLPVLKSELETFRLEVHRLLNNILLERNNRLVPAFTKTTLERNVWA